ncbi:MAG: class I SAM-dependent methyltransferase [Candidatus Cloacimonetes bacterium]|nr:class I SAM-dependent methyltransferase [Candidatus Cloacimonadota bacterium]MCF7813604.1 class I SAM-dependent methyltransferase [Candidatus Cloacimonadota bacterium]MCF7867920.1 class I SAM-dependent methyltransferase [Candidatus Cloacimonadota bacterium]MCF7882887.1 class I SAM-dependent methyltransferase [Candidatus Cloacimonadota bacterium]
MKNIKKIVLFGIIVYSILRFLNWISYKYLKNKIINRQSWDLNICCGHTDGGGVNADIVKHSDLPNFVLLDDIYNLPFADKQFEQVLCSHTIEHVDHPLKFHEELQRIGRKITYLVPPIWDFTAAFNLFEHKWLFLTCSTEFNAPPKHIKLPFADKLQEKIGQTIKA